MLRSFLKFSITAFWLVLCIEIISYLILRIIGINPLQPAGEFTYGRTISGYYVSRNSPNFAFTAVDGLNNFKRGFAYTDKFGFICDTAIEPEKPPNTVRIFLAGGSAAFGSLESQSVTEDTTYPAGNYNYRSSIAGLLKKELSEHHPGIHFEVINAATVKHSFVQEWLKYLSLLHRFNPDIIVNFTLYNDSRVESGGDPFDWAEADLQNYINSECIRRQRMFPFSICLVNVILDRALHPAPPRSTAKDNSKTSDQHFEAIYHSIANYLVTLNADGVHEIFCVQPMLSRRRYQKQLSPLELRLRAASEKNMPGSDTAAIFFDGPFSAKADSLVTSYGASYIDMNKEMQQLTAKDEFFVDYCHLTPFGNKFAAHQIAMRVDEYLHGKAAE